MRDFRLALVNSSEGKVGTVFDKIVLFCYHYDPQTGKYTLFATRLMQLGGLMTMLILGSVIGGLLWRERRLKRKAKLAGAGEAAQYKTEGTLSEKTP